MAQNVKKGNLFCKFNCFLKVVIRSLLVVVAIILLLFFLLVSIYFVDSLCNVASGNKNNPLFGAYVVVTESMVPSIKVNDAIVVKRTDEVNIGDIITFFSRDKYYYGLTITHRVIGKQLDDSGNYVYRTKGDNNVLADTARVGSNDIYGKVILTIPKFGYVQNFVASPFGFIISIFVPIVFVVVYEVWRIISLLRKRHKQLELM